MIVKVVHFSDSHNRHKKVILEECDIAIFSGDMSSVGHKSEIEDFLKWYSRQSQCTFKIFIFGNHEISADPTKSFDNQRPIWIDELIEEYKDTLIYLENSSVEVMGLKIWGSPITPWFHGDRWAFNRFRGEEIRQVWEEIPYDTDIVVTHGPPMYKLDYCEGEYVGCEDLRYKIKQIKPKLHLFGHIHHNYNIEEDSDGIIYSNACICDHSYHAVNKPNIFNLEV